MMDAFSSAQEEITEALHKISSERRYKNLESALKLAVDSFEVDEENYSQKVIITFTGNEMNG